MTALRAAGVADSDIYRDVISGKTTTREGLAACLMRLVRGDTLLVWKLDRLGRKAAHLFTLAEELKKRGVGLRSVMESLDTGTTMGWAMFQMIGVFAELERNTISDRVTAGMAAATAAGRKMGRKPYMAHRYGEMRRMAHDGLTCRQIAAAMGVSKSTVHRVV